MKYIVNIFILLLLFSLPTFAENKDNTDNFTQPHKIPKQIIDFTVMHTKNKQYNSDSVIYYVGKWNEFDVYEHYLKSCFGKYCGHPMYILDNGKAIRYASGCERDEIMSDGKIRCKKHFDSRIKYYKY